jgi:flagellar hook-associated protein 3 FlgL
MKTTFISSQAITDANRYHIMRMQLEMTKLQKEVVSGRVADAGVHLGSRTGISISLERDMARLQGIIDSNALGSSRLSATQAGLQSLTDQAKKFLTLVIPATGGAVQPEIAISAARSLINEMTGVLNGNLNGENLFAGINTDVRPINDFFASPSPARAAMETAFQTHFTFAYTDPQAKHITAADMTDFLTNVIEPQFMGAGWDDWSNATDETITARISLTETVSASVSANIEGVRRLAMAAATVAVFFEGNLTQTARDAILEHSTSQTAQAIARISQVQAQTGIVENRISSADERLQMQISIFRTKNSDLVEIDPYEASSRVSVLLAQIETAYTLTSRIRQLSLVRYLP